jgi:hypothetical protein
MDLVKLEPLDLRARLDPLEEEAITRSRAARKNRLRVATGILAAGSTMVALELCFMVLTIRVLMPIHWSLGLLGMLLVFGGTMAGTIAVSSRYFSENERRWLSLTLEPQALAFLDGNWERRERLLTDAQAFDKALKAFKALPARVETDEVDAGVVENLVGRRRVLEDGIGGYLSDFRAATEDERRRVAAVNAARGKPPSVSKRRLDAFKERVWQLESLEDAIDGLNESVAAGVTVDVSPYVAAQRLRDELAAEREQLLLDGLKPRKLPKPRPATRKLLAPVA